MYLQSLPFFATLVFGLAAPDPSPAPDADLVAQLLERQIEGSLPGLGGTIASGSICGNVGPISGCVDGDGATITGSDATASATFASGSASATLEGSSVTAGGTIGSDGATATLEGSSLTAGLDATASTGSTTLVVQTTDASGNVESATITTTGVGAVEASGSADAGAIGRVGVGKVAAGVAVGGLLAWL